MKKQDAVIALEQLIDAIKSSDKIDSFGFNAINEFHEIPTEFWSEKQPTGWVDIDFNIRFHNASQSSTESGQSKTYPDTDTAVAKPMDDLVFCDTCGTACGMAE